MVLDWSAGIFVFSWSMVSYRCSNTLQPYDTIWHFPLNVLNLLADTPSIVPVNGSGKDGLTLSGRELTFCCAVAYKRSLANSSRSCAT